MASMDSTPTTESVKYIPKFGITRQENIIKPLEQYYYFLQQSSNTLFESQALSIASSFYLDWVGSIYYKFTSRGSANLTSLIEQVLNQLRQDWIRIPNPPEVREYLLRYPDLANVLPFVCKIARERVGIHPKLYLEVYHDPEIEDEYLTLYVRQQHYDEEILDTIEDIRTQYEAYLARKSGWLLVTTDFRPPSLNNNHEL